MLEKTLTKLKRGILFLGICGMTSCLGPGYVNEVYQTENEDFVEVKKDTIKKKLFYDFEKSVYSSSLGWDFDHDGIINYDDPWPYIYGPYIDINGNGIVDITDWQISGYGNFMIDSWAFYSHYRWIGNMPNPWRSYYFYYPTSSRHEKDFVYKRREGNTTTNYDGIREENTRRDENIIRRTKSSERRNSTINESERRTNTGNVSTRRTDSGNNTNVRTRDNSSVHREGNTTSTSTRRSSGNSNSSTNTRRR